MLPDLEERFLRLNAEEPYRLKTVCIRQKLVHTQRRVSLQEPHVPGRDYREGRELLADLELIRDSLLANHGELLARGGIEEVIDVVACWGLHLATLDIRSTPTPIMLCSGRCSTGWARSTVRLRRERRRLLADELDGRRPLAHFLVSSRPEPARTYRVFETIRKAQEEFGPDVIGSYIVSMTPGPRTFWRRWCWPARTDWLTCTSRTPVSASSRSWRRSRAEAGGRGASTTFCRYPPTAGSWPPGGTPRRSCSATATPTRRRASPPRSGRSIRRNAGFSRWPAGTASGWCSSTAGGDGRARRRPGARCHPVAAGGDTGRGHQAHRAGRGDQRQVRPPSLAQENLELDAGRRPGGDRAPVLGPLTPRTGPLVSRR